MNGTLYIAASAALDHQRRLEVLTNNLANVNTAGFKADDIAFQVTSPGVDLEETKNEAVKDETARGSAQQNNDNLPATLKLQGYTDFSAGPSRHTGNSLDVALEGDGFFSVQTPSGVQYTRQGSFALDQEGVLVTQDGRPVMGEGGAITIEGKKVTIDEQGYVSVDGNEVDRLSIVVFSNQQALAKVGSSLFAAAGSGETGRPAENVVVKQGYLESSNVNAIRMMTDMIAEMRIVEAYQKMMRTADTANTKAVNELGRLI